MKTVMQHEWNKTPSVKLPRSVFNRSHGHKTTFNSGYLIPIYEDEALPGDTFKLKATLFARLQTLKFPVMDNIFLDTFYFAVPKRLLWEHWQQFQGERDSVAQILNPTEYLTPVLGTTVGETDYPYTQVAEESLSDYLGLPLSNLAGVVGDLYNVAAWWHRAYNLIYNEWFRDQNLIDPLIVDTGDGPDVTTYALQRRAKKHDYFTSCLPWPQKGPAIELPLGSSAVVKSDGTAIQLYDGTVHRSIMSLDNANDTLGFTDSNARVNIGDAATATTSMPTGKALGIYGSTVTGLVADLANATAATINSIREAFQLQRLLERDARGGTRYVEMIKSHFGVTCPDFRVQRPEYLGGGSMRINVHPVQQTSATEEGSPQGKLTAYAVGSGDSGFTKSFVEHCVILGLASVRADLTYQQGIPRMFSRRTRYDYYLPVLAGLGEQEVLLRELFSVGGASETTVFGYLPRWDEYRFKQSKITGAFRSSAAASLDVWHLSQDLTGTVVLGKTFIEDTPPLDRVVAVSDEPEIIFDSYFDLTCARVMPTFGVPGLVDHF